MIESKILVSPQKLFQQQNIMEGQQNLFFSFQGHENKVIKIEGTAA